MRVRPVLCRHLLRQAALLLCMATLAKAAPPADTPPPALELDVPFDLPRARVTFDITQAASGAVLLATDYRLHRWDGFKRTEILGMALTSKVFAVAVDNNGGIWAAYGGSEAACATDTACKSAVDPNDAGLLFELNGERQRIRKLDGKDPHVWALASQGDVLWLGTEDGVVAKRPGGYTRYSSERGLKDKHVTALAASPAFVAVGTRSGLQLLDIKAGTLGPLLQTRPVTRVAIDGDTVWVATRGGLGRTSLNHPGQAIEWVNTTLDVRDLSILPNGDMWLATWDGLYRRPHNGDAHQVPTPGLPDSRIVTIHPDDEGGLWIGTAAGGFVRGTPPAIAHFGPDEGLPFLDPAALVALDHRVWVAGRKGGVVFIDGDEIQQVTLPNNHAVVALAASPTVVWMATETRSILRVDQTSPNTAHVVGRVPDQPTALMADGDGRLWVGTTEGVLQPFLITRDGLSPDEVDSSNIACQGTVTAATRTASGDVVWVTDAGWLGRFNTSGTTCSQPRGVKPKHVFTSIGTADDNVLWIGNAGGDLFRVDNTHVLFRDESDGLPCDSVLGLNVAPDGYVWTACASGVARIGINELERTSTVALDIHPMAFSVAAGLRSENTVRHGRPATTLDNKGRLWVATRMGIERIDSPATYRFPGPLRLQGWESVNDSGGIEPVPTTVTVGTKLRIRPQMVALRRPESVRWRATKHFDGKTSRDKHLALEHTTVEPETTGRVQLVARVSNAYGIWSAPSAPLFIDVVAHWTRRPTTWLGALATVALLILSGVLWSARQARLRAAAIGAEREKLARDLHDHLGQGFASVGYHLQTLEMELASGSDQAADTLQRTRAVLKQAQDVTRQAIWQLRNHEAMSEDLPTELHNLASQMTNAQTKCSVEIASDLTPPTAAIGSELLQVAREAVTNAIKHAQARSVLIELGLSGKDLRLRVSDNGVGFDPDATGAAERGHFGIIGMYERLRRLDGTLVIDAQPGAGTVIEARVPLPT